MNRLYRYLTTDFRLAWACVFSLILLCLSPSASAQGGGFSLHYAPKGAAQGLKYPLKLGVPDATDRRFMPFHMMSDDMLQEPPSQAMAKMSGSVSFFCL